MLKRYLEQYISEDVKEKMVFISGPRQVGKTTLAGQLSDKFYPDSSVYFNWDNREDRRSILQGYLPAGKKLLIFDEIHKYKGWKNYLKGIYDKYKENIDILVTGSARLDLFKKGGDSLLGRYQPYRLHPLSINEVAGKAHSAFKPFTELKFPAAGKEYGDILEALLAFGGFPEQFIKQSERSLRRWHNARTDLLIKEDIRDLENIRDISSLQVMIEVLPQKVGSLFSLNSLREDLKASHKAVSLWVDIFERFYYHYRIYPYQSTLIKSLRKEPKLYLWDWSEIKDEDRKFENMVASSLLKFSHFLYDVQGYKAQLNYIRDKEQREVDFLISIDNKLWFCVEVKKTFREIPSPLKYFAHKLKIPFAYQVVREDGIDYFKDGIRVISASKYLSALV